MDFMQEEKHRLLCKRKSKPSASDYVVLDDDSIIKKKKSVKCSHLGQHSFNGCLRGSIAVIKLHVPKSHGDERHYSS